MYDTPVILQDCLIFVFSGQAFFEQFSSSFEMQFVIPVHHVTWMFSHMFNYSDANNVQARILHVIVMT